MKPEMTTNQPTTSTKKAQLLPCILGDELIVPHINSRDGAAAMEALISELGISDKLTYLSKSAHLSGTTSPKLMRVYLRNGLDNGSVLASDETIINMFAYAIKRGDIMRLALARNSEDSGLDKTIDTGLLTAYEDIQREYMESSERLSAMRVDDPGRPSLSKSLRSLRSEMLAFKELIAPAVQKVDVDDKRAQVNDTNAALVNALKTLG